MNTEIEFLLKVLRNGVILSGIYFISVWGSTQELNFLIHIKPIVIFLGTYVLAEVGKRYKIDIKDPQLRNKACTMIL